MASQPGLHHLIALEKLYIFASQPVTIGPSVRVQIASKTDSTSRRHRSVIADSIV